MITTTRQPPAKGTVFGKLTVIGDVFRHCGSREQVPCRCECGQETTPILYDVQVGKTTTCGCGRRTGASKANRTHGETKTRLYQLWFGMKKRCINKKSTVYEYYGGRGITFCKEWEEYFPFREWANANGYQDSLFLDRIDNDGNYEPANCRWVTHETNMRNTRHNKIISAFGESKCLAAWADDARCKVEPSTLLRRLNHGIEPENAMTLPFRYSAT